LLACLCFAVTSIALLSGEAKERRERELAERRRLAISTPPSAAKESGTPKSATKKALFVNTLGMKFVPVEITGGPTNGKRVLFSIWDTRIQDYAEYAKAKGITPKKPSFKQDPTHPVVTVSWDDAKGFCEWLTASDRVAGKISGRDEYRLPSDHEWSCAVGIGHREKAEESPSSKDGKIEKVYPWGTDWPPPKGAGNYGPSLKVDEFKYTSPVGSFPVNENGLYDMGGNVWQWCEDSYDANRDCRVLRGASWSNDFEIYCGPRVAASVIPRIDAMAAGFVVSW